MLRRHDPLASILQNIDARALNDNEPVPAILRQCLSLGGRSGSDALRTWAKHELFGYDPSVDLPEYRQVAAPICLDAISGALHITAQQIDRRDLPKPAPEQLSEKLNLRQPLSELLGIVQQAQRDHEPVRFGLPENALMAKIMTRDIGDPSQTVLRIYWMVAPAAIEAIEDIVRSRLVQLVAEVRAELGVNPTIPVKTAIQNASEIVINGGINSIKLTEASSESTGRRLLWWLSGTATTLLAIGAIVGYVVGWLR